MAVDVDDGRLRLTTHSALSLEWVLANLRKPTKASGRQHAIAALPDGARVFIKTYNPRANHSLWRRLRDSRAIAEGKGYLAFASAGIETPELIAWGEVRRRATWQRGIVITRLVDGNTVAEHYSENKDVGVLEQAAACLARVHRAGLAHGDPRLRNFLVDHERILPFDLCSWGLINERRRRNDLVKFIGSARTVTEPAVAERLLARYSECSAWRSPAADRLIHDAEAYAIKEKVP
ncbi:MAG: hypothetical protein JNK58_06910 [Phycisphaerae bacterium]|nr:hypothetical protein [Phycisphaerae bacterium]